MNKFITLALFALCATMAHGQIIYPGWNSNLLSQQSSSGSSSSAAASADAASSSNNGLVASGPVVGPIVGGGYPLVQPGWGNQWASPIVQQGLVGPVIAGPLAPQGWVSPLASPWLSQGYPAVGAIGPCGQNVLI